MTENKLRKGAGSELKMEAKNLKGFDLLKLIFEKGLLPPKRHMVLARALAEGAGTAMNIMPEAKVFGSWMGIVFRGTGKSFFR